MLLLSACVEDWSIEPCLGEDTDTCEVGEIDVEGDARTFLVSKLGGYACGEDKLPLILFWHASAANGASQREVANQAFAGLTFEETLAGKALVVYPDGLAHPDCSGSMCWDRDPAGRDVAFFDALVPRLAEDYCIDPEQVYSVGHSRGGRFVEVLACHRGESHVALAAVAAGSNNVESCPDSVPIWLSHGIEDQTIPFAQGEGHRDHWAERNHCDAPSSDYPLDTCTELSGCDAATPVVWCPTTVEPWEGHALPELLDEALDSFFFRG